MIDRQNRSRSPSRARKNAYQSRLPNLLSWGEMLQTSGNYLIRHRRQDEAGLREIMSPSLAVSLIDRCMIAVLGLAGNDEKMGRFRRADSRPCARRKSLG